MHSNNWSKLFSFESFNNCLLLLLLLFYSAELLESELWSDSAVLGASWIALDSLEFSDEEGIFEQLTDSYF